MDQPRILPVPLFERVGRVRELLDGLAPKPVPGRHQPQLPDRNLPCTVVRNPAMFEPWARMGASLRDGSLAPRDRELITLRVAALCGSVYEWQHHRRSAALAGASAQEIERVRIGPDADGWDPLTRARLRAVDELVDGHHITEPTWQVLRTQYTEEQMIELMILIGFYVMTAFLLNSTGVEVDAWLETGDA